MLLLSSLPSILNPNGHDGEGVNDPLFDDDEGDHEEDNLHLDDELV